jgi:hypothetical protein
MTEEQYAKQLDDILKALSGEHPGEPGAFGEKNSISEIKMESKGADSKSRFPIIKDWDVNWLCDQNNMDLFELKGLLTGLSKKGYVDSTWFKGGGTVRITPSGLLFLKSGGYTKEVKDQKANRRLVRLSSWGSIASGAAAVALFGVSFLQLLKDNDADLKSNVVDERLKRVEVQLQEYKRDSDSLSVMISRLPVNQPDTAIIESKSK